ncbi:hypothetical protein B0H16DRAFT_1537289 [Mycena metata]|uniref:Secreted protein n=1 Tax=Mycena metata TaxID=1033252 RepID=A0AAD7NEL3_9AGAR|nr:hypothetical protein B0H16DRAFT_1537289 [Mycena metata]
MMMLIWTWVAPASKRHLALGSSLWLRRLSVQLVRAKCCFQVELCDVVAQQLDTSPRGLWTLPIRRTFNEQ